MIPRPSRLTQLLQLGGPFLGDQRATTRITVEPNWFLIPTSGPVGNRPANKLPIRWFQAASGNGAEVEIPNLKTVIIDRQLGQDADTIEVDFYNMFTMPNGTAAPMPDTFGERGYLAWNYGQSAVAQQRWNQTPNAWANVLRENALLRVFQGYGGLQNPDGTLMSLADAISGGFLMQTGTFLVDSVAIEAQTGIGKLVGRSMAKLLIDQVAWPPTVPSAFYSSSGIVYYHNLVLTNAGAPIYGSDGSAPVPSTPPYIGSSQWVAVGQTAPIETSFPLTILDIAVMPDGQGYRLVGSDGGVFDYGSAGFSGSEGNTDLAAKAVSIDNTPSGNGYWVAAADGGVFAFGDAQFYGSLVGTPLAASIISIRGTPSGSGYYMCAADGGVFTFGDAVFHGGTPGDTIKGFALRPQGDGYWMVAHSGAVYSFGAATYHGGLNTLIPNPLADGAVTEGIDSTANGAGYRIVTSEGGVFDFGTAVYYTLTGGSAGAADGTKTSLTSFKLNAPVSNVRRTPNDTGYLMVGQDGGVFTFGTAQFHGALPADFSFTVAGNYCVDENTEIFTKHGWLRWDQVQIGDETLAIDPDDGKAYWEVIEGLFRKAVVDEPMVNLQCRCHSSLTTPQHKWLVYNRSHALVWTTSDRMNTAHQIPILAPYADAPIESLYDDAFVEIIAWFWTEGNIDYSGSPLGRVSLSQSPKVNPKHCLRIERALEKAFGSISSERGSIASGDPWCWLTVTTGTRSYRLCAAARDRVLEVCPNKVPTVDFLLSLTSSQLELFVQTSIDADGHRRLKPTFWTGLSQNNEERIRMFEYACHLAGYGTSTVQSMDKNDEPIWTTSVRTTDTVAPIVSKIGGRSTELYTGHIWCPRTRTHNWLARRAGTSYFTGNSDWSEIVVDFLLWAGFFFQQAVPGGSEPPVYGLIENTGAFNSVGPIPPDTFDKLQLIDCIKAIRDTVGFVFRVQEDGSAKFTPANIWSAGNYFNTNGSPTAEIPVLDERLSLTDYIQTNSDQSLRSEIIVSAVDPYLFGGTPNDVTVTRLIPSNIQTLHGIQKPAMIGVPLNVPVTAQDQDLLAEIQGLFCWLGMRTGQVSGLVDPAICPDDQIRIYERSTGETAIHYVTGVHTEHDLDSGQWLATYTTQWMGDSDSWAISSSFDSFFGAGAGGILNNETFDGNGNLIINQTFPISNQLASFLASMASNRTIRFRVAT